MHATIRSYEATASDEIRRLVTEEVLPNMRDTSGLIAFYLVDAGDGRLASLTLAESREAAERSNAHAAEWVRQKFAGLTAGPPEILCGEVLVEYSWNDNGERSGS
jgi:hypothetical protein